MIYYVEKHYWVTVLLHLFYHQQPTQPVEGPVWTSRERRLLLHNHYQSRLVVQLEVGIQIRGYNLNVNEVTSHLRADGQARPRPPPRAAQAGLCEGVREVAGFPGHLQALWHCA